MGFLFLKKAWEEVAPDTELRVFDVGRGCLRHEVTVHIFQNKGNGDKEEYIDLVAFRHHMRWAKLRTGNLKRDVMSLGI